MYVWFDALINYMSGIVPFSAGSCSGSAGGLGLCFQDGTDASKPLSRFWPANMHIVGKDRRWPTCVLSFEYEVSCHAILYAGPVENCDRLWCKKQVRIGTCQPYQITPATWSFVVVVDPFWDRIILTITFSFTPPQHRAVEISIAMDASCSHLNHSNKGPHNDCCCCCCCCCSRSLSMIFHPSILPSIYCIFPSIYPSVHLSIYRSIYLPFYRHLCIYLFYLSINLFVALYQRTFASWDSDVPPNLMVEAICSFYTKLFLLCPYYIHHMAFLNSLSAGWFSQYQKTWFVVVSSPSCTFQHVT